MSAVRGYAEVAADVRAVLFQTPLDSTRQAPLREAAVLLAGVAATLPTCPVCGGYGWERVQTNDEGDSIQMPCPDCDHGKVSIPQLVATWQAIEAEWVALNELDSWTREEREMVGLLDHLRSVRPPSPEAQENSSTSLATGDADDRERGDVADLPVPGAPSSPSPEAQS